MVKNTPANARDTRDVGLSSGLGRSSGGVNGNPLQYSCLEGLMDRGAWQATVHQVTKSCQITGEFQNSSSLLTLESIVWRKQT